MDRQLSAKLMTNTPLRLTLTYVLVAGIYIVLSDQAVAALRPHDILVAHVGKGLAFVAATGALLYFLLCRWQRRLTSTQASLERVNEMLKTLYGGLHDGVAIVGFDRRIVDCNQAFASMLGYEVKELVGTSTERLHESPEAFRRFSEQGGAELERRGVFRSKGQMRRKDGELLQTEHVVAFADGERTRVISIVRDLSEQRRVEKLAAHHRAYLDSLLANITDLVVVLDHEFRVVFASPSAMPMLGYGPEELLGRQALDLVHPEDHRRVMASLIAVLRRPGTRRAVFHRALRRDGSWLEVESAGILPVGTPIEGAVVSVRDVTLLRDSEKALREKDDQLKQAQKMEALGRLAGGVAHDFNNLLTVIFSYTTFLEKQVPAYGTMQQDVQTVKDAARRASQLTKQLLLLSRERVAEPRRVELPELVAKVEKMVRRIIGEDVRLEVTSEPGVPAVWIDEGEFVQVLMNLVVNARDAMPKGGELSLRSCSVEVDEERARPHGRAAGRYACVEVEDTGDGMSAETAERIFEPFFTTKGVGQGTGLGLSTSYGIIVNAGGWVEVESEPGEGAIFRLIMPGAHDAARAVLPASEHPRSTGAGETILVVEDDDSVRRATHRLLEEAGYRVLSADSYDRALALCQGEAIDLLLTDVVMPGLNGRELAEKLRTKVSIPRVLFMSGYTAEDLDARRVDEEEIQLLRKPFTELQLRERVASLLDQAPASKRSVKVPPV